MVEHEGAKTPQKTVLVIEFAEKSPPGSKLGDAIQQGKKEFAPLESFALYDEHALEILLENKADTSIGMVVVIHPHDMETLEKLPSLYPDIYFTVIDAPRTLYAANVQNVQFKEGEGVFLLGTIAAISSAGRVSVMAMEDTERNRSMSERFVAGVKHIHPDAQVSTQLDLRPSATQHTRLATTIAKAFQEGTAVLFSFDNEIIEQALRDAKPERKLVISGNPPPRAADSSRLLTYLVKRYDLALLDVLRIYSHRQWHAGEIELGVAGGYVDYSLNADNVEIFPKDAIDQIETLKDYTGQGIATQMLH
ncbi:MAG: BMP family ABC transporter substrate-binding protein [Alphaproteobacteria bacterium]|nr:BMP family ABC transporter substrate-binding protein [Alphaproteobacteria bacterium]